MKGKDIMVTIASAVGSVKEARLLPLDRWPEADRAACGADDPGSARRGQFLLQRDGDCDTKVRIIVRSEHRMR